MNTACGRGAGNWTRTACTAWIVAALVASARGQDEDRDMRVDENGRQQAHWVPDRLFDHQHLRVELDIPDLHTPELTGVATLRAAPIGIARQTLSLHCTDPQVDEVTVGEEVCLFDADGKHLRITLPRAYAPGEVLEVVIRYSLDFSKNKGEALTWSRARESADSPTLAAPQIHAQGQAELNRRWFPCHDVPHDKITSELLVTIPDSEDEHPYEVLSNGRLVSKEALADKRTRWHWLQDKPHSTYLITLAIGKFAVIEVGGESSARPGLAMPVYTTIGTEDNVREVFKDTARMMAFFEQLFDEPYPWDKYAQAIVRDFAAGGMENTSATLLMIRVARARPGTQDDLIAHELAHQWTGDLLTCRTWDHVWLNEGWATYAESLWFEHAAGDAATGGTPEKAREAYRASIAQTVRGLRRGNRAYVPRYSAMAGRQYADPERVFIQADNPYSKGAVVLHMLRMKLGDEIFFKGTRDYIEKYKFSVVETDDFRRELERVSGVNLEQFFDQWTRRPGMPRLAIDFAWEDSSRQLRVTIEQTQRVDRLNPPYVFELPLLLTLPDDMKVVARASVNAQTQTCTFDLPASPKHVSIDPELTVLAAAQIRTALPEVEEPADRPPDPAVAEPEPVTNGQ